MSRPENEVISELLNSDTIQAALAALVLWKRGVLVVSQTKLNQFMIASDANKEIKNNDPVQCV